MPNIQGEYSLSETALRVGASPAWINKIQSRTKICEKEGERGRRATFTEDDIRTLINVKLLRALDYEISEIADIYRKEESMIGLFMVCEHPMPSGDNNYIIHPYHFEFSFAKDEHGKAMHDKEAKEYEELVEFIITISKEVERRAEALAGDLTGLKQKMWQNGKNAFERE